MRTGAAANGARASLRGPLLGGATVGFAASWNIGNVGALAISLSRHYHTGLPAIGLFTTANFVGELGVMIPGGLWIDRYGAKRAGIAALALCLIGNIALAYTSGVVLALAVRTLIGFGVGLGFLAGSDYVRRAGESSLFQGIYGGASLSAAGVALGAVPPASDVFGWRAPYVTAAAVALLGIVIVLACPATPSQQPASTRSRLVHLVGDRVLARLGLLSAAGFGISVIVGNWLPSLLARTQGYGKGTAGGVAALTIVLGIVGRPLGGLVARRHPAATRALIVGAFVAGAMATAVFAVGGPLAFLLVAAAAIGVAGGTPFGPIMSGAARAYPQAPGLAIGAMNLYPAVAIVAGMPLIGLTFAWPGDGRIGFAVLAALWASAALAIPAGVALTGAVRGRPPGGELGATRRQAR